MLGKMKTINYVGKNAEVGMFEMLNKFHLVAYGISTSGFHPGAKIESYSHRLNTK